MSASESGAGSQTGGSGGPPKRSKAQNVINNVATGVGNYIKSGGMLGVGIRAIGKQNAKNKTRNEANVELGLGGQDTIASLTGNNNDSGNDTAPTQVARNVGGKIIIPPTTAEVSQSSATDVTYDARKTKAKGRSMTIRTNSRGIGKNTNTVLGTKSLLGA